MRALRRIRPYLRFLRPVRVHLAGAILFGLLYAAATGLGIPTLTNYVFPRIFTNGGERMAWGDVLLVAAYIPFIFLVRAVAGYLNGVLIQFAGTRVLEGLRLDYFRKLQILPLSFVQNRQTGDLISRGLADTTQLQFVLTQLANDGIKQPGTLLFALGFLGFKAAEAEGVALMLVCLAVVPLVVLPVRYIGRKVTRRAQELQAQLGAVTALLSENLSAAREVRAYGLEGHETSRFEALTRRLFTSQMKITKYAQALSPAIEVIAAFGVAGTLLYAFSAGVSKDDFLGVVTALFLAYEPIKKLGALNNELSRAVASLDRLEVVLLAPVEVADPARPAAIPDGQLRGGVQFDAVSFAYVPGQPVLREVTIDIPPGTVCALVGPSGAGKSTFANLVPRFFEASSGAVRIDGIDVRDLRIADLRGHIAVVSQDPVLFNESIRNNLLLGRPSATEAEVIAAAKDAFAHDFIVAEPEGYATTVGERGGRLSGGQRQRLALARAFLRNAPILILDEATSALDSESEAAVQQALQKLMVGKTVFIIAHRFSTIRAASLILVFEEGRIVARGSHAELHASCALYRNLYDRQSAGA
ncbi:MAG: ABC transporter ATP-binding protein [Verrucomicrobia bacterium]|nr:ABC transporter ATP-binding protein [Verrucomicrobiota bacterium]